MKKGISLMILIVFFVIGATTSIMQIEDYRFLWMIPVAWVAAMLIVGTLSALVSCVFTVGEQEDIMHWYWFGTTLTVIAIAGLVSVMTLIGVCYVLWHTLSIFLR